jgi:pyruvate formate lyase activating enzyme
MQHDVVETTGLVFNIQRFSVHDGPGIRTTVFLKGCPLRCAWCSNPEALQAKPQIITRDAKCIRCGKCVEACPEQAIAIAENKRIIQWDKCNQCMQCAEVCPSGAIEATGRHMTVAEVMDPVGRDAGYYRHSGGGMTISGGEPLVQWQFALRLLREAKRMELHTALDTTGYADWEILDEVLNFTDLVLYDLKHPNSARHQESTGVPNERILDNLRRTAAKPGLTVWVRYPVIPRFNDSEDALEELCAVVLPLKPAVAKISLLPYHKFGEAKYAALGKTYPWKEIPTISEAQVEKLKKLVESHGIEVDVGR